MKFKINNTEWEIKEVNEATINNEMKQDGTLGVTIYKTQEILLLESQANIIKTLKHELTHVWLYEYGHPQDDDSRYSYEDVCEIVASSNDFINEVVEQYKNPKVSVKVNFDSKKFQKELNKHKNMIDKIMKESIKIGM